jgi:hypothetical protein
MATDNPFASGAGPDLPSGANVGNALPPVALDVRPILERCWELLVRHPRVVLGSVLIPAIPQVAGTVGASILDQLVQQARDQDELLMLFAVRMGIQLVTSAVSLWFLLGQSRIVTRLARGLDAEVLMLFGETGHLPGALVAWFALTVATFAGLCALVVPGIVIAVGLSLTFYAMVDQDLGPFEALSESWRLTDGHKATLFALSIALTLLAVLASCLTLGLGLFVLVPLLTLAQGVMYHAVLHLQGPRPATA